MSKYFMRDIRTTQSRFLNDNYLIVGASGTGKTTLFVDSQIQNADGSIIVADTKSNLYKRYKDSLEKKGYQVCLLDFINLDNSSTGYNPLDRLVAQEADYKPRNMESVAHVICPQNKEEREPFWTDSARMMILSYLAFYLEIFTHEGFDKNLRTLSSIISDIDVMDCYESIFNEDKMDSYVGRCFRDLMKLTNAERTMACVYQFVTNAMKTFDTDEMYHFFTRKDRISLIDLAKRKTALFLNISDNDRTNDALIGLFYTQLFQELITYADKQEDGRLPVPVNVILDDFATNAYIDGFANIISVIRSRGISVSIMLQGLSQLQSKYSSLDAQTIINNCDRCLYLGSNEFETIKYFSLKADKPISELLNLPLNSALIFERGFETREVLKKFGYEC